MGRFITEGNEHFYFIITPDELETVLQGVHLLQKSGRIPEGYQETPKEDYLELYRGLYQKLASGQLVTNEDVRNCRELGVVRSLEKYGYRRSHIHRGVTYVVEDFQEPCPSIITFPFYLGRTRTGKNQLILNLLRTQFPENQVGLELFYPKRIYASAYDPAIPAKDLEAYQDFLFLRDRISEITKPLRLNIEGKEVRPRVRISEKACNDVERFHFLEKNGIRVVK